MIVFTRISSVSSDFCPLFVMLHFSPCVLPRTDQRGLHSALAGSLRVRCQKDESLIFLDWLLIIDIFELFFSQFLPL